MRRGHKTPHTHEESPSLLDIRLMTLPFAPGPYRQGAKSFPDDLLAFGGTALMEAHMMCISARHGNIEVQIEFEVGARDIST